MKMQRKWWREFNRYDYLRKTNQILTPILILRLEMIYDLKLMARSEEQQRQLDQQRIDRYVTQVNRDYNHEMARPNRTYNKFERKEGGKK